MRSPWSSDRDQTPDRRERDNYNCRARTNLLFWGGHAAESAHQPSTEAMMVAVGLVPVSMVTVLSHKVNEALVTGESNKKKKGTANLFKLGNTWNILNSCSCEETHSSNLLVSL